MTIALTLALAAVFASLAGCGKPAPPQAVTQPASAAPVGASAAAEKPLPESAGSAGDIPDTQVFVSYRSEHGKYSLDAPEGWARTENGADVKFADHFDGVQVRISAGTTAPTVDSVQREQVPALQKNGRAVTIGTIKAMALDNGVSVVAIEYGSNSDPDPVTGKQVRLDNVTYVFYRPGTLAELTLWAPTGADNVDQWKRISESFRWQ
jgi:predicted small lipoprotein YifL